jgi:protein involved in sex pheromone biosynthesis
MKSVIRIFFILPVLVSLFACGTARKLEQTTNELNQVKETNSQQAQKIAPMKRISSNSSKRIFNTARKRKTAVKKKRRWLKEKKD